MIEKGAHEKLHRGKNCKRGVQGGGCKKFCVYETLNFPDKNPICKILLSIL